MEAHFGGTRDENNFAARANAATVYLQLFAQTPAPQPAIKKTPAKTATKSAAPTDAALTNRDVIRLVQAKISEDLIVAKIRQSKTRFDTSVDALVALKAAGVTDSLLNEMMHPAPNGSSAATPRHRRPPR